MDEKPSVIGLFPVFNSLIAFCNSVGCMGWSMSPMSVSVSLGRLEEIK